MATSNKYVKLTLSVETLGTENIAKLKSSVLALAKEGGDAAPEFQKLADAIDKIGNESAALRQFRQLAEETNQLGAAHPRCRIKGWS